MGSAAAVLQTFQTDEWNAEIYGALSVVSNVVVSVKNKANILHIAYSLHKCNKQLQLIFDKIHAVSEGKVRAEKPAEPISEERAREGIRELIRLYRKVEYLYASLRTAGLTNNSITSGQLLKLRSHGETILDLADWLETHFNTEEVNGIFARASDERTRGEIYDLEQVG
jgi:hypothetical protein